MVGTGTKMPVEWPCERQPEHSRAARDSAVKRIGYKENEVYFHVPEERELFLLQYEVAPRSIRNRPLYSTIFVLV